MILKTIAFAPKHIPHILAGTKTATLRFWRKSDIVPNETIFLIDAFQKMPFALARVTSIEQKTFDQLDDEDKDDSGHEESFEDFQRQLQADYKIPVLRKTPFLVVRFAVIDDGQDHLRPLEPEQASV